MEQEKHQEIGLQVSVAVPEKHFSKWLQIQSQLAKLKIWIGFAEFVLSLIAGVALIAYVATKAPENLKHLLAFLGVVGTGASITVGARKLINRNKRDAD